VDVDNNNMDMDGNNNPKQVHNNNQYEHQPWLDKLRMKRLA
jgi:hypothetical protein